MRAISIFPDPAGRSQLEAAIGAFRPITLCRSFPAYPDPDTLARAVRVWAPAIVFVDVTHAAADQVNHKLATEFPQLRRVAIHASQDPEVFRRVLRLGMCELLNPPFSPEHIDPVLMRLVDSVEREPRPITTDCRTAAFLPAKAGVGASTLAAHATWAVAQNPEERVLLMDFDRHSGITAFQFNQNADYTLSEALNRSAELDDDAWRGLTKSKGNIDLLLSRPGEVSDANTESQVPTLLKFAHRIYSTVHIDLPDSLDPHTLGVLHQADQIFLVATPELASLRLARLKALALQRLELEGRMRLLLNRMNRRLGLSMEQIEEAVGIPVFATCPCDYEGVSESLRTARPAPRLLTSAEDFLTQLDAKPAPRRRFLELFSLPLSAQLHIRASVR